jgi:hypothetical protein
MAANDNTNRSWIDYYTRELQGYGKLAKIGKEPLSFFDGIADSYFEDEKGFQSQVEANPENLTLLAGPLLRTVQMIRNMFLTNHGGRTSPS